MEQEVKWEAGRSKDGNGTGSGASVQTALSRPKVSRLCELWEKFKAQTCGHERTALKDRSSSHRSADDSGFSLWLDTENLLNTAVLNPCSWILAGDSATILSVIVMILRQVWRSRKEGLRQQPDVWR